MFFHALGNLNLHFPLRQSITHSLNVLSSEMANRTNITEPNRTRPCSVCSSSAPHRTEPNSVLVRFVFGGFSNIDILVRFCSNRTRTEQYLCSVRVLQVRTTPSKVEDHMKDGCYLTGKWIQWVSGSIWTSVERSKGETEGRAQKRQEIRRRRPPDHVYHSLRIKV